jgi:5-hydroxyisourate hydrolase-like protein (transthyretin family)
MRQLSMAPVGQAGCRPGTVADGRIDDVVVGVVRDGLDGARRLAGVAADADGRVDQVLLEQRGVGSGVHNQFC